MGTFTACSGLLVALLGLTEGKPLAPKLEGLGTLSHAVTTDSEQAQGFFDQGLRLTYAFNHAEALRAFQEAARLDPDCAMAYWGQALALGPNINQPLSSEANENALKAIQKAMELRSGCSESERAYIEALAPRFSTDPEADRAELDAAYARAMGGVSARFPDDDDAATLHAASRMETQPWAYWMPDGSPKPATTLALEALEAVLDRSPDHPGAIHYYIHLVEASPNPDRAVPHAERLASLMPGAGHIVHMPSHIYIRVGRYDDASDSNVKAVAADERYLTQCHAQGLYPNEYYPHNMHFLWAASTMEGRSDLAIRSAGDVTGKSCCVGSMLSAEDLASTALLALVRFGRWEDVLNQPRPADEAHYALALWHHARALAFAAKGQLTEADSELALLEAIAADEERGAMMINFSPASEVLVIATRIVRAEIAAGRGDHAAAIGLLREAVGFQDRLAYMEPPTWHYPVRQSLGAVLLEAGRPAEAEAVYRVDLREWRENGWSLFGLLQSLRAQGRSEEAREVERRFQDAWQHADVVLTSSVFR